MMMSRSNSSSAPRVEDGHPPPSSLAEGRGESAIAAPISTNLALYQIEQRLSELLEMRNTAVEEGALPAEIEAIDKLFEEYFLREVKKVDGICHALRVFSDAEEAARKEAKRLTARADHLEAQYERIKAATLRAMQDHGVRVLETPTNKLRVQANGGKEPLEINESVLTPDDFRVFTLRLSSQEEKDLRECLNSLPNYDRVLQGIADRLEALNGEPDNEAIRASLKHGNEIPGAKLLPRGFHLRVE